MRLKDVLPTGTTLDKQTLWNFVFTYGWDGYDQINNFLRTGHLDASDKHYVDSAIPVLDMGIKQFGEQVTRPLYRGTVRQHFDSMCSGNVYHDKAFISTSKEFKTAIYHASKLRGIKCIIQFEPPMFGLNVDKLIGGTEQEIIVPRGLSFEILEERPNSGVIEHNKQPFSIIVVKQK